MGLGFFYYLKMGGNPPGSASFSLMEETLVIALHETSAWQSGKTNPISNYDLKKAHRGSPSLLWDSQV